MIHRIIIGVIFVGSMALQAMQSPNPSSYEKKLFQAAAQGLLTEIKDLPAALDINKKDAQGQKAITIALKRPLIKEFIPGTEQYKDAVAIAGAIALELLDRRAQVDFDDMLYAARFNLLDVVKRMRAQLGAANGKTISGQSPLCAAIEGNAGDVVRYLIAQGGIDLNAKCGPHTVFGRFVNSYYLKPPWDTSLLIGEELLKAGALIDESAKNLVAGKNRSELPDQGKKEALEILIEKYEKK